MSTPSCFAAQALFEGGAAFPVGFSAISAVATCITLVPVFLADKSQWAVPKRDYMPGAPLASLEPWPRPPDENGSVAP